VVLLIGLGISLMVGYQVWQWMFCRIEIEPGRIGVLLAKTGWNLPSGQIVATDSSYKGIQLEVLSEGRHFYNPFLWDWEIFPMFEVPTGFVGVTVGQHGKDFTTEELKQGKIIAAEGEKGIRGPVRNPGKYRINPYAERIELHRAIEIPAGFVGVVTNLTGRNAKVANTFLVGEDEKGVTKKLLTPGIHYVNPYIHKVTVMDCRSQRFELTGTDALRFPSSDAFDMTVHLTVEWAIEVDRAPEIFVRIGEMDHNSEQNEILQKVIIPAIRGHGRIEGSKYSAIDYIAGISRQVFQKSLFDKMKASCETKGILIKSVLINDITPPQEIATPIREREIAKEELNRNLQQLKQAMAEQDLAHSEEKMKQEKEVVQAKTENKVKIIQATNRKKVAMIEQEKLLKMEATILEASQKEAHAILSRGKAQSEVVFVSAKAEAESLKKSIEAFGNPDMFAYYEFLNRVAPSMGQIFANTEGVWGQIFQNVIPDSSPKKGGQN
jgi:regulator of protease activity HflC (stomatin/prohibitin superfamily)